MFDSRSGLDLVGEALFEAIGRNALPGATPADRAAVRHAAVSTLLAAYQAAGIPLPEAEPTPETLIRAAEAEVAAHGNDS